MKLYAIKMLFGLGIGVVPSVGVAEDPRQDYMMSLYNLPVEELCVQLVICILIAE